MKTYNIKEAAELLKIHPVTLTRKIKKKEIIVSRIGWKYIITEEQIQKYLNKQEIK